jgi:hypothetical protein
MSYIVELTGKPSNMLRMVKLLRSEFGWSLRDSKYFADQLEHIPMKLYYPTEAESQEFTSKLSEFIDGVSWKIYNQENLEIRQEPEVSPVYTVDITVQIGKVSIRINTKDTDKNGFDQAVAAATAAANIKINED